jgi:hypothetical protein
MYRVIRLLKAALMQASFNCALELNGIPTTELCTTEKGKTFMQAPYNIPALHPFTRSSIYMLFDGAKFTVAENIFVKTTTPSGKVVPVSLPIERIDGHAPTMRYLAAKAAILDLEGGISFIHSRNSPSVKAIEIASREVGEQLAIKYHLVSKWTRLVAVEKDTKAETHVRLYRA